MCYSANISYAAAGVLAPLGVYCIREAWRKSPRYLPLAATPLMFSIQQFFEGSVWTGLATGNEAMVEFAARVYLFFAVGAWPTWALVIALSLERRPVLLRILGVLGIFSSGFLWFLYMPFLAGDPPSAGAYVVGHSIRYASADFDWATETQRTLIRVGYLAACVAPLLICSERRRLYAVVAISVFSAVVSFFWFEYAFASIWCFMVALLSALLAYIFTIMPSERPPTTPVQSGPAEDAGATKKVRTANAN